MPQISFRERKLQYFINLFLTWIKDFVVCTFKVRIVRS